MKTEYVDIEQFEYRFEELIERAGSGEIITLGRAGAPVLQLNRVSDAEDADLILHRIAPYRVGIGTSPR